MTKGKTDEFWQADYWSSLFDYMDWLSEDRWYQFTNNYDNFYTKGQRWRIFEVCFPQARAVSDPSTTGDEGDFLDEYKKCTKEWYVEYIAGDWGNNKGNGPLTLADATSRICAYAPERWGMTQDYCDSKGKAWLDTQCADWEKATVSSATDPDDSGYDYYAAYGINTVWDCLSQFEQPSGVARYTVEEATTAHTAYCTGTAWSDHSFDSAQACTAASADMIKHCTTAPNHANHATAEACFDELVSVTMLREHEITKCATNKLCTFGWKMFGFESAGQCWENWNNLYDACGYHNKYMYWLVEKFGGSITNTFSYMTAMEGKDMELDDWSDAFDFMTPEEDPAYVNA